MPLSTRLTSICTRGARATLITFAAIASASTAWTQSRVPAAYAGTASGSLHRIDLCGGSIDWTSSVNGAVQCVAASRLGTHVVVGSTDEVALFRQDGSLVWSVPSGVNTRNLVEFAQVAIDERGRYVVAAHSDGNLSLYHNSSPAPIWTNLSGANSVAISWTGNHVFAGGANGVEYHTPSGPIWSAQDGIPVWMDVCGPSTLTVDITKVESGAMYMVGGSNSGDVCLWDSNGSLIWSYVNPKGDLMSVAMNPSGDRVAAGNDDSSDTQGAQVDFFSALSDSTPGWQTADGTPVWTSSGTSPGDDVRAVEFEATAPYHLSGGGDDFVAGGSGIPLAEFNENSSSPAWTGTADREQEDIAFMELDPYDSYVAIADIGVSSVAVFDTGGSSILHTVTTTGNCRSVSMPAGPIAGNVGSNYCTGAPNSYESLGATISAWGSPKVLENDLNVAVIGAIPNQFGLFFYGRFQIQVPFGDGFLCVTGDLHRINPPGLANACGVAQRRVDLQIPPQLGDILPGTIWNFQYWYRDPAAGGSGFNFSDAVEILFQ